MNNSYSQGKAFKAIMVAAFRSIIKSPSSLIFTIAFPLVFILAFGFIGDINMNKIKLAIHPQADTSLDLYKELKQSDEIKWITYKDSADLQQQLRKGLIHVVLNLQKDANGQYQILLLSAPGSESVVSQTEQLLQQKVTAQEPNILQKLNEKIHIEQQLVSSKEFKAIDFVLPGQLGFSLLAASVFGTAFVFFNLRQGLVLKRFFATPIKKMNILLAEGSARMFFQLLGALLILLIGYFFLGYTLIHGWMTVLNMLLLCAIGILIFMAFGFIISGIAKSESIVPPLANMFTLPQFLLAGTFFPIESLPTWIQPIAKIMPLTYLNEALRAIGFEGASLWDVRWDLLILIIWGIIGYGVAARLFKWE